MKHIGLFEGIGGFSLAARWMGWETIAWCEWNPFCQTVLKYHFPNAEAHSDITKTDFTIYRGWCDILTGGFPCQPYSMAGKRLGKADDRHLWPEMLRAIREIQPTWVIGENVSGLINWNGGMVFDEVQADLESQGYEVIPFILPACAVNAPHRRDRVWFVAYCNRYGFNRRNRKHEINTSERGFNALNDIEQIIATQNPISDGCLLGETEQEGAEDGQQRYISAGDSERICVSDGDACNTEQQGLEGRIGSFGAERFESGYKENNAANTSDTGLQGGQLNGSLDQKGQERWEQSSGSATKLYQIDNWHNFPTQSPVCCGDDGLPRELDGITFPKWRNESIKAYGNAIVPQVALQIYKSIEQFEEVKQV